MDDWQLRVEGLDAARQQHPPGECLAKGIGGLRVTFGAAKRNGNVGNYCAEIEAVGHPSSADANPVVPGVVFTVE